ncbi:MAG: Rieske (2Fe-2S) protein [Symbiopectobacterium sp.]|uniref:Rieske (2Fe-2S) protein n=1 Tax=Symbiopectobacterium sp. TaxID=2952789 RepID=UPI0039EAD184
MCWVRVCEADQIQENRPFSASVEDHAVGIYLLEGDYYALEDICPHAYALLSQGFIEDGSVECPLHGAVFDIKSGQCLGGPGERDLHCYRVRRFENQIQILLTEETVA